MYLEQQDENPCVVIYSECNFKGDKMRLCDITPDLKRTWWNVREIRSVKGGINV